MITHVVAIKFKADVSPEDIDDLETLLDALPDRIDEIQSYDFGRDVVHGDRSFDFALVAVFANLDCLKRYQDHPAHGQVTQRLARLGDRIVTVDYENAPYAAPTPEEPDPWTSADLFRQP